jgi:hypothetical protein
MLRTTILVSDLSGYEIDAKDAAQLIIRYADPRRGGVVLDVAAAEVEHLAERGGQAHGGSRPRGDLGPLIRVCGARSADNVPPRS